MTYQGQEPKQQLILRDNTEDKYLILPNTVAQDANLPYDALGVLCYLLSKPRDWKTTVHDLCQRGNGKNKIYRILGILEDVGYVSKPTKHKDKTTGLWVWTSRIVANYPKFKKPCPYSEDTDFGDTENGEIKEQKTDEKRQITKKDIAVPKANGADSHEGKRCIVCQTDMGVMSGIADCCAECNAWLQTLERTQPRDGSKYDTCACGGFKYAGVCKKCGTAPAWIEHCVYLSGNIKDMDRCRIPKSERQGESCQLCKLLETDAQTPRTHISVLSYAHNQIEQIHVSGVML
jgi:hypothetical protein